MTGVFFRLFTDITQPVRDSRVRAAEDEEGAALRDGWSLFFDAEFRQPLEMRSRGDFWEIIIFIVITTP